MPQFGIHAFDAVGFRLVWHGGMHAWRVEQSFVGGKQVAIVPDRLRCALQHCLQCRFIPLFTDRPTDDATGAALYESDEVDPVFFLPTKLYNSSISTMSSGRSVGIGADGNWLTCALTQCITVTGSMPR